MTYFNWRIKQINKLGEALKELKYAGFKTRLKENGRKMGRKFIPDGKSKNWEGPFTRTQKRVGTRNNNESLTLIKCKSLRGYENKKWELIGRATHFNRMRMIYFNLLQ